MNNEEKTKKIVDSVFKSGLNTNRSFYDMAYNSALEMAKWKDEQLDSAIDKALERNGDFLKQGKITQYGYDIAFATIQNIREYLKQ